MNLKLSMFLASRNISQSRLARVAGLGRKTIYNIIYLKSSPEKETRDLLIAGLEEITGEVCCSDELGLEELPDE